MPDWISIVNFEFEVYFDCGSLAPGAYLIFGLALDYPFREKALDGSCYNSFDLKKKTFMNWIDTFEILLKSFRSKDL
jgi:hypothetical protein